MLSTEQFESFEKLYSRRRLMSVVLFYLCGCLFYMNEENWTLIDSVYFITVTITSVGCFTIVYAVIGLGAIFGIVHEFITQYLDHIQTKALEASSKKQAKSIKREQDIMMVLSVFAIVGCMLFGGVCYSYLEGWTFMDSVYFASMTTLTVGYGDLAVSTQTARCFSIFYMTLSVITFAVAIGNFQAVNIARSIEERRNAMLQKELDVEALLRLDEDGDGKVTLIEFVTGALHQLSGVDPEKEIHPWIKRFYELDIDGNGYLDQDDLAAIETDNKEHGRDASKVTTEEKPLLDQQYINAYNSV